MCQSLKAMNSDKAITLYTDHCVLFFCIHLLAVYGGYEYCRPVHWCQNIYCLFILAAFSGCFSQFVLLFVYYMERILAGRKKLQLVFFAVSASLLTVYLYVDSKIYSTMNLHLNRFVIESLAQEDALNEIGMAPKLLLVSILPIFFFPRHAYFYLAAVEDYCWQLSHLAGEQL